MHRVAPVPSSPPAPSGLPLVMPSDLDLDPEFLDLPTPGSGLSSTASDRGGEDDGSAGRWIDPRTLRFLDAPDSSPQETKHRDEVEKPTDRVNHNGRISDTSEPRSGDSSETKGLVRRMSERLSSRSSRDKTPPATQQTTPHSDEKKPISDGNIDTPPQTTNPTTRPTLPRPEPRLADRLAAARRAAAKRLESQTDHREHSTVHRGAPGLSSSDVPSRLSPVTPSDPDPDPDYDDEEGVIASVAGTMDAEDDEPMDDTQFSRLKRVFSMRDWTTEKGRGKGKDRGGDRGGSGSGRRRSALGFN